MLGLGFSFGLMVAFTNNFVLRPIELTMKRLEKKQNVDNLFRQPTRKQIR